MAYRSIDPLEREERDTGHRGEGETKVSLSPPSPLTFAHGTLRTLAIREIRVGRHAHG